MAIEFLEDLKYEWVTLKDKSGVEYPIHAWTYLDTLSMHQEGAFWIVSHLILKRSLFLCPDAKTGLRCIDAIALAIYNGEIDFDAQPGTEESLERKRWLRKLEHKLLCHDLGRSNGNLQKLVKRGYQASSETFTTMISPKDTYSSIHSIH
jgi:hypothetical protein